MKRVLINVARTALRRLGIGALHADALDRLITKANAFDIWDPQRDHALLSGLTAEQAQQYCLAVKQSTSQLRQDLFVLTELNFKRNGFFVEFGATNGVDLSNTYLLETQFGWRGVLAEPARCWHSQLARSRSAAIEKRCVWSSSGATLKFNEFEVGELSTIDAFSAGDSFRQARNAGRTYDVQTISLDDLLEAHGAPQLVDYLSIDTEGSELEILRSFDFSRRAFAVITCEHNYTPAREQIHELLSSKGYRRKHQELSEFDDWYVRMA
jgi:FkbM family methyltransferase